jgi:predicted ATPase
MIHLRSIDFRSAENQQEFPFNLPFVKTWSKLVFSNPITFFVGENGSGKSTLMEAIACAVGSITIGSESAVTDPTLKELRSFANKIKLIWNKPTRRGFFLRAEDFFGYIKQQTKTRTELLNDLQRVDKDYAKHSQFTQGLARMAYERELSDMKNRYGDGLEVHSHGESYLELFQTRFVPGGLYLLDEPEAALSPLRQLGFLSLLKIMVEQQAQFIIATHSPILMAYPDAKILSFDHAPLKIVGWDTLEHVTLTRDFLNNRESFLRYI